MKIVGKLKLIGFPAKNKFVKLAFTKSTVFKFLSCNFYISKIKRLSILFLLIIEFMSR